MNQKLTRFEIQLIALSFGAGAGIVGIVWLFVDGPMPVLVRLAIWSYLIIGFVVSSLTNRRGDRS